MPNSGPATKAQAAAASSPAARRAKRSRRAMAGWGAETRSWAICCSARRRCSSQSARVPGSAPPRARVSSRERAGPWRSPASWSRRSRALGRPGRRSLTIGHSETRKAAANRTSPRDRIRGEASIQSPSQEALRKTRPIVIGTQRRGQARSHQRVQRARPTRPLRRRFRLSWRPSRLGASWLGPGFWPSAMPPPFEGATLAPVLSTSSKGNTAGDEASGQFRTEPPSQSGSRSRAIKSS